MLHQICDDTFSSLYILASSLAPALPFENDPIHAYVITFGSLHRTRIPLCFAVDPMRYVTAAILQYVFVANLRADQRSCYRYNIILSDVSSGSRRETISFGRVCVQTSLPSSHHNDVVSFISNVCCNIACQVELPRCLDICFPSRTLHYIEPLRLRTKRTARPPSPLPLGTSYPLSSPSESEL